MAFGFTYAFNIKLADSYHHSKQSSQVALTRTVSIPFSVSHRDLIMTSWSSLRTLESGMGRFRTPQVNTSLKPSNRPLRFDLPRKTWITLDRIRTGHGRCADTLYKWGRAPSPECNCGAEKQTVRHIIAECPQSKLWSNKGLPGCDSKCCRIY